MRQFFLPVCLLGAFIASPAFANPFDMTPDPTRDLADPTFVPVSGQLSGATGYSYANSHFNTDLVSTGAQVNSATGSLHSTRQDLSYGLTDDVTLRANISYSTSKADIMNVNGSGLMLHAEGFSNPNFGISWRALDQRDAQPVSFDITLDYAPDVFDRERATNSSNTGSIARGGDLGKIGTQVSYRTTGMTFAGLAGANYYGDTESRVKLVNTTTNSDDYWGFYVGAQTQARLGYGLSLDLGGSYNYDLDTEYRNSTGNRFTRESPDYARFNLGLNYSITPAVVASLTYDYGIYSRQNDIFLNPATTRSTEIDNSSIYGVRLRYNLN